MPTKKMPVKKLLLAGAGHAHIGLLRRRCMKPSIKLDITLISAQPQFVYSGMLPGWMAGHYTLDNIRIDIKSLCSQAGVRFIQQPITAVDAKSQQVMTTDDRHYSYDVLSLNTGADTDMRWSHNAETSSVIAIRPLSEFITHWQQILTDARQSKKYQLAIIGAGAAAIELVMAAQVALQQINTNHQVTLVCGEHLLSGFNPRFQQRVMKQLYRHGIRMVQERATDYRDGQLSTATDSLTMDAVIAATGVMGSAWTAATDLQTIDNGFIAVNTLQQSVSHPNVFAVGDVATRVDKDMAHSGVHAVHGGAIEADNLLAYLRGEPMQKYQPKTRTLYLLSCGDKYAIGSWGRFSVQGRWVWYLKRQIDQRFINAK